MLVTIGTTHENYNCKNKICNDIMGNILADKYLHKSKMTQLGIWTPQVEIFAMTPA